MNIYKKISTATLLVMAMAGSISAKDYSGAELYTSETWMYGKFEARMKMAAGSGTVSSMFLYHNDSYLGGNEPWVEVDIEILGKNPSSFQSNIITGYGEGDGQPNRKITSEQHHPINPASNASFHTYGLEWTPNYVAWTLDGQVVRKTVKGQESGCKTEKGGTAAFLKKERREDIRRKRPGRRETAGRGVVSGSAEGVSPR